ncbi:hypothetical protein FE257_008012 [Aspergillus nanangensis]|uniref:SGNH hydrolase-type esterase domain-containing protein n=1 Tax=Aspergillus nanangensis TaxID=2582783 RepID=A0AAD4CM39_ASPNN|nr:hypothetical protein FE257_008012 [Aspergillus nanangensis]
MRAFWALPLFSLYAAATILENGQPRLDPYPGQAQLLSPVGNSSAEWKTYQPGSKEISYKGRWDDQHISWWSAPGVKFAFTGQKLALSFGQYTDKGVLVAYRIAGQDWQFANVTANDTYQFVGPETTGVNLTEATKQKTFEMRVQLAGVSVARDSAIFNIPEYEKMVEIIGDSDTSWRASQIHGDNPPKWNFKAQKPADMVVINIGTNDNNPANNVSSTDYYNDYVKLVDNIHKTWPRAQISLWGGFGAYEDTYVQGPLFVDEIKNVYNHFKKRGNFIHYFDTTGILQHNDIAPQWHPTDVGHVKVASHFLQWVKIKFGWSFAATGPEVQHGTLYWNDQQSY